MSAAAFGKALIDLVVNVIGDAGAKIELGETVGSSAKSVTAKGDRRSRFR